MGYILVWVVWGKRSNPELEREENGKNTKEPLIDGAREEGLRYISRDWRFIVKSRWLEEGNKYL